MAGSTILDFVGISGNSLVAGTAFEVDVTDSHGMPQSVPKRVRRRLLETPENKPSTPSSLVEIEAKLKEADLRHQQFHEWLESKAWRKPRSPTWSTNPEDLAQCLEAKLSATKQKSGDFMHEYLAGYVLELEHIKQFHEWLENPEELAQCLEAKHSTTKQNSNFMSGWKTRLDQSLKVQLGLQTLKTLNNASKPSFLLLSKRSGADT